jgi:hypothetical protein
MIRNTVEIREDALIHRATVTALPSSVRSRAKKEENLAAEYASSFL